MFAICLEASHSRGMGHLFRSLHFASFLAEKKQDLIFLINDDEMALRIIDKFSIKYETVDLLDLKSDWESRIIKKHRIDVWINDRLDTDIRHSENVKKNPVSLITFDDRGNGAELADINFAALSLNEHEEKGKKVLRGIDFLILDPEIKDYRRLRSENNKIIVTLGGSDTYGVTIKVAQILKKLDKKAIIIAGSMFRRKEELHNIIDNGFLIKDYVPSLIKEFYNYDLAITGGGVTPFEANASGLPCIIIANENFEIPNGQFLENLGTSVFAGFHEAINEDIFKVKLDIEKMSRKGLAKIKLGGAENIYREIKKIT